MTESIPSGALKVAELASEAIRQLIACHDEGTCPAIDVANQALAALASPAPQATGALSEEAARLAHETKVWVSQVIVAAHRKSPAQIKVAVEGLEAFIDALAALSSAKREAEPVAWMDGDWVQIEKPVDLCSAGKWTPLYAAAPLARSPLTEEWVSELWCEVAGKESGRGWTHLSEQFARAIEAAHGIVAPTLQAGVGND